MEISSNRIDLTSIDWREVQSIRLMDDKLGFVFKNKQTLELSNLSPSAIDLAFRTYESYLRKQREKETAEKEPKKKEKRHRVQRRRQKFQ